MPRWMLWTLSVVAFAIIGRSTISSTLLVMGHKISYPEWIVESRDYWETVIVILILVAIVFYEGRGEIGVVGSVAYNVRASAQGAIAMIVTGMLAFTVCSQLLIQLTRKGVLPPDGTLLFGIPNDAPDTYHHILWSIHAGITEEIIVVGLIFFLLRRAPWTVSGKPFWLSGWATTITIVVRLSYHTYHGLMVIPIILLGWLLVRLYRTTGSIIPLIVAHTLWDLFGLIVTDFELRLAFGALLIIPAYILTKGPTDFGQFGFPHVFKRDHTWPGHYWASWRWEHGIERPANPAARRDGVNPWMPNRTPTWPDISSRSGLPADGETVPPQT